MAEHLENELKTLYIEEDYKSFHHIRNVAEGVASYLAPEAEDSFNTWDLALLLSRGLWSLGCNEEAEMFLKKNKYENGLPIQSLNIVNGNNAVFAIWRSLLANKIVTQQIQQNAKGCFFAVNLKHLIDTKTRLELIFYRRLKFVLNLSLELFDESSGKGELRLKHLYEVAELLRGTKVKEINSFVRETCFFCKQILHTTSVQKAWENTPDLKIMDLNKTPDRKTSKIKTKHRRSVTS
jgi:hypothetical protein